MEDSVIRVTGLGQCSLDYIGSVKVYPGLDVKCEFNDLVIEGGGPVATAMVALSRWGIHCSFCGVTGDDSFADLIRASLKREGIDLSRLISRKNGGSQFAFIVAEPQGGKRTIFWRRPTGEPYTKRDVDREMIAKSDILHTDGIFPEASLEAAKIAREYGVKVVVDAGSMRDGMIELVALSDYFIASQTFASKYMKNQDPLTVCQNLAELGPQLTCVTLGANGYAAFHDGQLIRKKAYSVSAADTTGCGDLFHAGFIYGLSQDWPHEKSLRYAAWAAAMVSRYPGGRKGIPRVEDFDER